MPTQLLIYKTAVPLTWARHGAWSVETGADHSFSREINSVPLMAVEFPEAATEYAIVFAGSGTELLPMLTLGLRASENLFLAPDARWDAKYLPAFIRRYPFVFSRSEDRFVLCADEAFPGFNQTGRGQRLFNDDATPSPYVETILKFLQDYEAQLLITQRFCARLLELDLLEPMQASITMEGGAPVSLAGFMVVNRDRLKALPAETLAALARTDELELLYLHLRSMRNFEGLRARMERSQNNQHAAEASGNGAMRVH